MTLEDSASPSSSRFRLVSVSPEGTVLALRGAAVDQHVRIPQVSPAVLATVNRGAPLFTDGVSEEKLEEVLLPLVASLPVPEHHLDGWVLLDDSASNPSGDHLVGWGKTLAELTAHPARSFLVLGGASIDPSSDYDTLPALGAALVRLRIHLTMGIGTRAKPIATQVGLEGSWDGESVWYPTAEDAYDYLQPRLRPGDTVVVTGFAGQDNQLVEWLRGGNR